MSNNLTKQKMALATEESPADKMVDTLTQTKRSAPADKFDMKAELGELRAEIMEHLAKTDKRIASIAERTAPQAPLAKSVGNPKYLGYEAALFAFRKKLEELGKDLDLLEGGL